MYRNFSSDCFAFSALCAPYKFMPGLGECTLLKSFLSALTIDVTMTGEAVSRSFLLCSILQAAVILRGKSLCFQRFRQLRITGIYAII